MHPKKNISQESILKIQEEEKLKDTDINEHKMIQQFFAKQMGLIDFPVPEFHLEYKKFYPKEQNHAQKLEQLFWEVKSQNMALMGILNEEHDLKMCMTPVYQNKRFGYPFMAHQLEKVYRMKPGTIITEIEDFKKHRNYSNSNFFHSFNNSSQIKVALNFGKNYVSIGFSDLHLVLNHEMRPYKNSTGPVNLFLYDCCPFVCAKSKVLLRMFQDESLSPESIFQVWFSSGWSSKTESDFLVNCVKVLEFDTQLDNDVRAIIEAWLASPRIKLSESRQKWITAMGSVENDCYNLTEEIDRVQLARYYLTGELLASEVGSKTFFSNPPSQLHSYKRWNDECFLYSQNLPEIKDNGKSFLSSVVDDVLGKIALGKKNMVDGQGLLKVHIYRNRINPENTALLDEIKSLKPWVVVWSNLCDYFTRVDFIFMARYISDSETMHSGHTMNWVQSVFGTEISDYHVSMRKNLIDEMTDLYIKLRKFSAVLEFLKDLILISLRTSGISWDYALGYSCLING